MRRERAAVINKSLFLLLGEVLLVLADIPVFRLTGKDFSYVPIIFGIVVSLIPVKKERKGNAGLTSRIFRREPCFMWCSPSVRW